MRLGQAWPATNLFVREVALAPGQSLTVEVDQLTPRADSVVHAFTRFPGSPTWFALATNDNVDGTLGSRLVVTNSTGSLNTYRYVVRARDVRTRGVGRLRENGSVLGFVPVGGSRIPVPAGLLANDGDQIVVTSRAPSPGDTIPSATGFVLVGLASGGTAGLLRTSGAPDGGASIGKQSWLTEVVVGVPTDQVAAQPLNALISLRAGQASLYANPPVDSDGDGLGDALEVALGLCPGGAVPCPWNSGNPWDSDGDGVSDGEELFGVRGAALDGSEDFNIPRWGGSPARKDVYVELDTTTVAFPDGNPFAAPLQGRWASVSVSARTATG